VAKLWNMLSYWNNGNSASGPTFIGDNGELTIRSSRFGLLGSRGNSEFELALAELNLLPNDGNVNILLVEQRKYVLKKAALEYF
jgi:hypothetical protein